MKLNTEYTMLIHIFASVPGQNLGAGGGSGCQEDPGIDLTCLLMHKAMSGGTERGACHSRKGDQVIIRGPGIVIHGHFFLGISEPRASGSREQPVYCMSPRCLAFNFYFSFIYTLFFY